LERTREEAVAAELENKFTFRRSLLLDMSRDKP
jgi:hypothetical protein